MATKRNTKNTQPKDVAAEVLGFRPGKNYGDTILIETCGYEFHIPNFAPATRF